MGLLPVPRQGAEVLAISASLQRLANARFLRFVLVGGLNTALNYGVYSLLLFVGAGHVAAATLSFVLGLVVSFKTQGRLVFESRGNRGFAAFLASWLCIYVVYVAALDLMVGAGIDPYVAGALLLAPVVILSYVVLRFVVFRHAVAGRPK